MNNTSTANVGTTTATPASAAQVGAGGVGSGTTESAVSSSAMAVNSQARMGQLLDDQDHKRCFEGNHRALLAENLDQLRGLVKVLETDDWKYSNSSSKNQFPLFGDSGGISSSVPRW